MKKSGEEFFESLEKFLMRTQETLKKYFGEINEGIASEIPEKIPKGILGEIPKKNLEKKLWKNSGGIPLEMLV